MKKSDLVEHKALVLARFSLVDAQAMCGHVICFERFDHVCPSCGVSDVCWLSPVALTGQYQAVDGPADAVRMACRYCPFEGDAVTYVMANFNISRLDFALQRIEDYLAGQGPTAFRPLVTPKPSKMMFKNTARKRRKRVVRTKK